jgi:hypothetical protein
MDFSEYRYAIFRCDAPLEDARCDPFVQLLLDDCEGLVSADDLSMMDEVFG